MSAARVCALVLTFELCAHQGEAGAAVALAVAPVAAVAAGGEGAAAAAPQVRANVFVPRYRRATWAAQQALLHVAGDGGIAQLAAPLPAVRQRACFLGSISADRRASRGEAAAAIAAASAEPRLRVLRRWRRSCASRAPGGRSTRLPRGADSGVAGVDMCFKYSVLVVCAALRCAALAAPSCGWVKQAH